MTIKDIARESGYAVGTVSRVLNHNPSVRPEAREKILAVVAQYGYQPNANAKHLKQQAYEGLALVVKGTQNALFADLLDKLQAYVEKCGYTPTVYYINETGDEMAYAQMLCTERKPYGRTCKRNIRNGNCKCGTDHCNNFRTALRVNRHNHVVDGNVVTVILRE